MRINKKSLFNKQSIREIITQFDLWLKSIASNSYANCAMIAQLTFCREVKVNQVTIIYETKCKDSLRKDSKEG